MDVKPSPEMKRFIEEKVNSGDFASANDVIHAGLQALMQQSQQPFPPGELEKLLAEGEKSIEQEGTLDGEQAFLARRARREQARKGSSRRAI